MRFAKWSSTARDACTRSEVPFFFKQVGGRTPKAGGRMLDGRLRSDYPFFHSISDKVEELFQ